ncbi:hypothetical protein Nepgr_017114 [Nepenthes gracilis]|uniref:Uncharacterized protein n=1 Tax=Nepenthes gracilis TaxID=150966 RepID=A0AAD3SNU2_NEPGR|nr:hypothetical protein Nepgr_017114 [Nepenthes gracilis]
MMQSPCVSPSLSDEEHSGRGVRRRNAGFVLSKGKERNRERGGREKNRENESDLVTKFGGCPCPFAHACLHNGLSLFPVPRSVSTWNSRGLGFVTSNEAIA